MMTRSQEQQATNKKRRGEDGKQDTDSSEDDDVAVAARSSTDISVDEDLQDQNNNARDCLVRVFSNSSSAVGSQRYVWHMLCESWKRNRDLAFPAVTNGHVDFHDLPSCLQTDRDFVVSVLQAKSSIWYGLPESLRKDPVYARSVTEFESFEMDQNVAVDCPGIHNDRGFWLNGIRRIMSNDDVEEFHELLNDFAPHYLGDSDLMRAACLRAHGSILKYVKEPALADAELWKSYIDEVCNSYFFYDDVWQRAPTIVTRNRDLMLKACRTQRAVLATVDAVLLQKEDFIQELLEDSPLFLKYLPKQAQLQFPDLVIQSLDKDKDEYPLAKVTRSHGAIILGNTADDFLEKEDFVMNWIGAGGRYYPEFFAAKWSSRKELWEWFAIKGETRACRDAFKDYLPKHLRCNKEFMTRMIKEAPCTYWSLDTLELKTDYEIALLATVSRDGLRASMWRRSRDWDTDFLAFFDSFCKRVWEKWRMGSAFPGAIHDDGTEEPTAASLPHSSTRSADNAFLSVWQEGERSFTPLIREFADMPATKDEFALLEEAVRFLPKQPSVSDPGNL